MSGWFLPRRVAAVVLACFSGAALAGEVAASTDWKLLGNGAEMQHYSSLAQIDIRNVSRLGLVWSADIPTADGLTGNALVEDGVVYQSGGMSRIWANDLKSGRLLWTYDPKVKFDGKIPVGWGARVNRGLALWGSFAIVGTADCRLVAVDRRSGKLAWSTTVCDTADYKTITGAPRVGGGKVFIGHSNLELGVGRGHVDAVDAATGKRLWRFYTMPGDPSKGFESKALERAARTWGKEWWKVATGVNAWDAITYDPVLNLVYFGTGAAQPQNPRERGTARGDELFTNSIVAVHADTGEYAWHYQPTPDDAWDYNAASHLMVLELPIGGAKRRVIVTVPKNGFFYVLDARTGKLLSARNIVPVNWASRIDVRSGRPVVTKEARYFEQPGKPVLVRPGGWGAHSWHAMSFSPRTGLVYVPATDLPMYATLSAASGPIGGHVKLDWTRPLREPAYRGKAGRLIAWDPLRQTERWSLTLPSPTNGGVLATGGGLVFQGTAEGAFRAYDAASGKQLWEMQTGSSIQAAPTTVSVEGRQLILVPVGIGGGIPLLVPEFVGDRGRGPARLLAFALDGKAKLGPLQPELPFARPPRPRPTSKAEIARGRSLFDSLGCYMCHGLDAERYTGNSAVPDLRRASALTHDTFAAIVVGGLRRDKGMPIFAGQVTPGDLGALQAFILDRAWAAHLASTRSPAGP